MRVKAACHALKRQIPSKKMFRVPKIEIEERSNDIMSRFDALFNVKRRPKKK